MTATRFAPSPTGNLHIGGARTAILSWLFAKKLNGHFVLRIEDTDQERSKPEYTQSILKSLDWLDLKYDSGPFYQSQRYARYQELAHELVRQGKAYYCYSTSDELNQKRQDFKALHGHDGYQYDKFWRDNNDTPPVGVMPSIRLKLPSLGSVSWKDIIKGKISIPNQQIDDFVILRSDGSPTYNFCVVVDDSDMKITHVLRGDDHINNTPKQIHIYQALNRDLPSFGHVPLILNMDGSKQSKRDNVLEQNINDGQLLPMTNLNYYQDNGILPQAIINYLLLISFNNVKDEIFTKEEFVDMFSFDKLGKNPIKFDLQKLIWINQKHMRKMTTDDFVSCVGDLIGFDKDLLRWDFIQSSVTSRAKTTQDFKKILAPIQEIKNNVKNYSKFWNDLSDFADDMKSPVDYLVFIKQYSIDNQINSDEFMKNLRMNLFNGCVLPIHEVIGFLGVHHIKSMQLQKTFKM